MNPSACPFASPDRGIFPHWIILLVLFLIPLHSRAQFDPEPVPIQSVFIPSESVNWQHVHPQMNGLRFDDSLRVELIGLAGQDGGNEWLTIVWNQKALHVWRDGSGICHGAIGISMVFSPFQTRRDASVVRDTLVSKFELSLEQAREVWEVYDDAGMNEAPCMYDWDNVPYGRDGTLVRVYHFANGTRQYKKYWSPKSFEGNPGIAEILCLMDHVFELEVQFPLIDSLIAQTKGRCGNLGSGMEVMEVCE